MHGGQRGREGEELNLMGHGLETTSHVRVEGDNVLIALIKILTLDSPTDKHLMASLALETLPEKEDEEAWMNRTADDHHRVIKNV